MHGPKKGRRRFGLDAPWARPELLTPTMSQPTPSPLASASATPDLVTRSSSISKKSVSRSNSLSRVLEGQFRFTPRDDNEDSAPASRESSRPPSAWSTPGQSPTVEYQPHGTW